MNKAIREQIIQAKTILGESKGLDITNTPVTPHELFGSWFQTAVEKHVPNPHAMTVSTVDVNGYPDSRILILKDLDEAGWYFASSSESEKGKHLQANPHAALNFYWPILGKQIRIKGSVEKMDPESNARDFLKRGTVARAIALLGKQSEVLEKQEELDEALKEEVSELEKNPNTVSSAWTQYRVAASEVEFWQAADSRKHSRLRYQLDNGWKKSLLWP
ncbi:pyridoxine/pyridoxamine 5'-phosphate oxidase [Oceanobacillus neutriphilus]|uniref:Pyridoxamine 5'-phosphate oxidase n=1 Tax=Oceanobacillus neutriphilus TaxID=531815 RepID=A0ABQ2P081_9BACI|nr:pyridoxal 5'-phosphate synthase [Oceanobacillus neutriphilus]GGP15060.1 pyridoxamine 5'-phosphate oxidase [Oceanobacillus neutriphilus]